MKMRLIDADKLKEHFKEYTIHSVIQVSLDRYALKVIEEQPTVDAVPVIRCRECKHHQGYNCKRLYGMQDAFTALDNDYCSRAERKEES